MITICWILGIIVGFLPLMGWHQDTSEGKCVFTGKIPSSYLLFFVFVSVIIPTTIFIIIYSLIYRVIHQRVGLIITEFYIVYLIFFQTLKAKSAKKKMIAVLVTNTNTSFDVQQLEKLESDKLQVIKRREIKATKNMAIIVIFYVICWLVSQPGFQFEKKNN